MEDYRLGRCRGAIPRSHKIAQCRERTSERANGRTSEQGCSSFVVRSKGVERLRGARLAVRYRAWLIREFREIKEFRDVRAMPATNQVSDVLPLNRAARSLTSLNSLISLNSLLTARYHHAPKLSQSFSAVLSLSWPFVCYFQLFYLSLYDICAYMRAGRVHITRVKAHQPKRTK